MLRESDAGQLLAEIFDHVGPLELPMHQHIQTDFFLEADGAFDLASQECFVLLPADLAFAIRGSFGAHFACLWERTDSGCRKDGEGNRPGLDGFTLRMAAGGV